MSKTELAKNMASKGDYLGAMKVMKTWRFIDKNTKSKVSRALSAKISPDFYLSIGENPERIFNDGVCAIDIFFNNYA